MQANAMQSDTDARPQGFDHTRDLHLAAFLIGKRLARLKGIAGTRGGDRIFEFDRTVDPALLLGFHGSDEKAVLDAYKSLKAAMYTR